MSAVTTIGLSANAKTLDLLTFHVGEQTFGLPITHIIRIIEMVTIIQLPGGPDMIQGIINVQGKVVPVMDLRQRFGLPVQAYGLHTPIILIDANDYGRKLGLIVDEVEGVFQIPYENLEIAEAFIPTGSVGQILAFLAGVAKIERRLIVVLDAHALLTPVEQNQLSLALAAEETSVD
jgi:purine-binding chemotaxis protein CheW